MPLFVLGVALANRTIDCGITDINCLLYDLLDAATCCVSMRAIIVGCGWVRCNSISRSLIDVRPFVLYVIIVIVGVVGLGSSCGTNYSGSSVSIRESGNSCACCSLYSDDVVLLL